MLRVKNEKQTNKQQQHNKDSVTQSSRVNVWSVINVKNKCLIMISTISVMTLRYAIVLLQCDVFICCLVLVLWHYAITFDYFAFAMCWFVTVPWRSAIILCYFCHCILVFLNFDIRNSSFAVVICHFHSVRFIMVFCQQCCCVTKIFNTWIVILASVQSNLKRKKQLLHLISLVLLQLKGNPGKHLLIKENRWITNYKFSTQNFFC